MRTGRQLSLFGVEASDPSPADLSGLLAGPGQVVRMGGTARVSVVVDAGWRVHVLVAELAARGLAATWVTTVDGHLGVRTAYTSVLAPLGAAWLRGAVKYPPAGFHLDGSRLRLWVAAAGTPTPLGFLLRLGPSDADCWEPVGAALAAIGLPAVLVGPRASDRRQTPDPVDTGEPYGHGAAGGPGGGGPGGGGPGGGGAGGGGAGGGGGSAGPGGMPDSAGGSGVTSPSPIPIEAAGPALITGPAYRITGRRRLARLAELVGDRPPAAPDHVWPT